MKTLLPAALLAAMLAPAIAAAQVPANTPDPDCAYADSNCDGTVNISDINALIMIINGWGGTGFNMFNGWMDVNCDDGLDELDVAILGQLALGQPISSVTTDENGNGIAESCPEMAIDLSTWPWFNQEGTLPQQISSLIARSMAAAGGGDAAAPPTPCSTFGDCNDGDGCSQDFCSVGYCSYEFLDPAEFDCCSDTTECDDQPALCVTMPDFHSVKKCTSFGTASSP